MGRQSGGSRDRVNRGLGNVKDAWMTDEQDAY